MDPQALEQRIRNDNWELLCSATPEHIANDTEVFKISEWTALVACAEEAAGILHVGGKLP